MLANHPNDYVYFNTSVGGIQGAFGRYETDYWGNCLRQASDWLGNYYLAQKPEKPARINADGDIMGSSYYLARRLGSLYLPAKNTPGSWDYRIALSRGLSQEELLRGKWPPPGTIHEVKAGNVTLCAVVKKSDAAP